MTRMHSGVGLDINVGCFELLIVVLPVRFHSSTHSSVLCILWIFGHSTLVCYHQVLYSHFWAHFVAVNFDV